MQKVPASQASDQCIRFSFRRQNMTYLIFSTKLEVGIKVFLGEAWQPGAKQDAESSAIAILISRVSGILLVYHGAQFVVVDAELLGELIARSIDKVDLAVRHTQGFQDCSNDKSVVFGPPSDEI